MKWEYIKEKKQEIVSQCEQAKKVVMMLKAWSTHTKLKLILKTAHKNMVDRVAAIQVQKAKKIAGVYIARKMR